MHFTAQTTIRRPRERVLELIGDPANLPEWQAGLIDVRPLAGERGQVGARSEYLYELGGIRLHMVETQLTVSPPELFISAFDAPGARNLVENRFLEEDPEATRWIIVNDFRLKGWLSVAAAFVNESVRKQVLESMSRFKRFAENQ